MKITVSLPSTTVDEIKKLASKLGISGSEVLRRAVSTELFFDDIEEKHGKVLVELPDQPTRQIVRR